MAITSNITDNQLSPIDKAFVDLVKNKLTLFGQIPYSIPEKMVIEVIKSSARYFYKYYDKSWKQSYYHIKQTDIIQYAGSDNFVTLALTINPRIRVVKEIYEANISSVSSISAAMYDSSKSGNKNDLYGSVVNNNLFIIEASVKLVEARTFDNIFSSRLPFDFSQATHELILKKVPKANVVLDVYVDNEIHTLYNDSFFERHVLANCKKELKRLIGGHTFELPGGVVVASDEICNDIEDASKVEELIKSASGVGDIIMKRR